MLIGTRKSRLALVQTEMVMEAVREHFPELEIELAEYDTMGDRQLDRPLAALGGKGAFTQDLEKAMLEGRIDIAVHSAKDMPVELPEGLAISAVLKRGDSRDVWISSRQSRMAACPTGTIAGTGSRRRALQAGEMNPGLIIKDIRGNVPTRLKKLAEGQYDGIILAAAGLKRLGYLGNADSETGSFELDGQCFYYEYLPENQFFPAAGQGIIAVETRQDDCQEIMDAIHDEATWLVLTAERAFLKAIGGGCNEAAAISAKIRGNQLTVKARYADDMEQMQTVEETCMLTGTKQEQRNLACEAGRRAAGRLLGQEDAR